MNPCITFPILTLSTTGTLPLMTVRSLPQTQVLETCVSPQAPVLQEGIIITYATRVFLLEGAAKMTCLLTHVLLFQSFTLSTTGTLPPLLHIRCHTQVLGLVQKGKEILCPSILVKDAQILF